MKSQVLDHSRRCSNPLCFHAFAPISVAVREGTQRVPRPVCSNLLPVAQDAEQVPLRRSRIVQTLNVPQRVRLGPARAAALPDGLFEQPARYADMREGRDYREKRDGRERSTASRARF